MKGNVNYMRDLMLTGFEISKRSGVPMLYLGNPGVGKTTIVNLWAKRNGYHVESLIGSAFDRSEILGYMVNDGGSYLKTKDPEWFHSIAENEQNGKHSILFIDEIAGAPKDVQASLYRLIFERTIGNGNMLPESTIIASASNYKENLPAMCDITSPNINRFCVVNFGPKNFEGLFTEFLQEKEDLEKNLPEFKNLEYTSEFLAKTAEKVREIFVQLNETFSGRDSTKGSLNVKNKVLNNIFDADYSSDGEVYNFISGRTIAYFKEVFRAMCSMGLKNADYIGKFTDGLIGLGFNSFTEVKELNSYRKFLKELTKDAISSVLGVKKEGEKAEFALTEGAGIAQKVEELSAERDSLSVMEIQNAAAEIYLQILVEFKTGTDDLVRIFAEKQCSVAELSQMRSDYNAVELFKEIVLDFPDDEQKTQIVASLSDIIATYKFYMNTFA